MQPRIALLNAAHDGAANRRNFRRELDATLVEYDATERDLPDTFAFDGCLVTGSRASVYWEEPWIADLADYVREAVDRQLPTLGVCFGHQVLAHALGGDVGPMDEYEIGYRPVEHDGTDPLLEGVPEEFTVFTTHSDRVEAVPPGADVFAENDYGVHGFRHGPARGVQFHPEYDPRTAREVTKQKEGDLPAERMDAVLEGITEDTYAEACAAKRLFANFTDIVREQASDAGDGEDAGDATPAGPGEREFPGESEAATDD